MPPFNRCTPTMMEIASSHSGCKKIRRQPLPSPSPIDGEKEGMRGEAVLVSRPLH